MPGRDRDEREGMGGALVGHDMVCAEVRRRGCMRVCVCCE